jgi:DNA (cytosine-5)-methyltransferase 1
VAVDTVEEIGRNVINYMNTLNTKEIKVKTTHNKGEWSELLLFVKLLGEQQLFLADSDLNAKTDFFNIHKVTTNNLDLDFLIIDKSSIEIVDKKTGDKRIVNIFNIITP